MISTILEWVKIALGWLIEQAYNLVIDVVNAGISQVCGVWQFAVDVMPASMGLGVLQLPASITNILGWINWFVPLNEMVVCIYSFLAVYVVYISLKPVLKFVRLA